ncbi:hypothetical protein LTR16_006149, partial [Cryomyces antarcticus]
ASPAHTLSRRRTLRRRKAPYARHLRLPRQPRSARIHLVHVRRNAHRGPLRRTRRVSLPPRRQRTLSQQSLPPLHVQALAVAPGPGHAIRQQRELRHPHLPLAAAPQLPRPAAARAAARPRRPVQAAEDALRRAPEGARRRVGRGARADGRDVLWRQDPQPDEPAHGHDGQHADGRRPRRRAEEAESPRRGGQFDAGGGAGARAGL